MEDLLEPRRGGGGAGAGFVEALEGWRASELGGGVEAGMPVVVGAMGLGVALVAVAAVRRAGGGGGGLVEGLDEGGREKSVSERAVSCG